MSVRLSDIFGLAHMWVTGSGATAQFNIGEKTSSTGRSSTATFTYLPHTGAVTVAGTLTAGDIAINDTDLVINADCAAAPAENASLILTSSNGATVEPATLLNDSTNNRIVIRRRTAAGAELACPLHVGTPAQAANVDASLVLNSSFGAVARQGTLPYVGADQAFEPGNTFRFNDTIPIQFGTGGGDLVLTPNATDVLVTGTGRLNIEDGVVLGFGSDDDFAVAFDNGGQQFNIAGVNIANGTTPALRLDTGDATTTGGGAKASGGITVISGTSTANGAAGGISGNVSFASGNTTQTTAHQGGASGTVTIASGATQAPQAANGGNSGAVTVETGATDTAAAGIGGNSGNLTLRSGATGISAGASTAGATGTATLESGASTSVAGGTSGQTGNVLVRSGASDDATTGTVTLHSGNTTAAAADSGLVLIDTGTVAAGRTSGTITISTADGVDAASGATRLDSGDTTSLTGARATGNILVQSGGSVVGAALVGGASGNVTVQSGNTMANFAGATGGASGNIIVQSGDADSNIGTSGSSGTVIVESGFSDDANSGNVTVQSGTASVNSGNVVLETGVAGGARGILDVNIPEINFATQDTAFLLEDNDATALIIGAAGATNMLNFDTRNAAERVDCNVRLTTTDNVAAGTVRNVGGLAAGIIVPATHVDPAGAGDADEAAVTTYAIPANTIKAGTTIRVDFAYQMTVGATIETLVMRLRLGWVNAGAPGTIVAASTSMDPATGSGSGYAIIKGRVAPAAVAAVAHFGVIKDFAAAGAASALVQQGPTATNFATNGALNLTLTADFANAEAAGGDTVSCEIFDVQVIG